MVTNLNSSYGKYLLWIFSAFLAVTLAKNAFYAHPMADDYCYSVKALNYGNWFDAVVDEYIGWGGRYSATAVMSLFALNFDIKQQFGLFPLMLLVLTICSFYVFFSSLHFIAGNKKDWLLWGLFSFCVYIATVPALAQIIYWMAGGVTYTTGYGFLLIVLGLLIRLTFAPLSNIVYYAYSLLVLILVFILAGFSEVAALLQILFLFVGTVAAFVKTNKSRFIWISALVIAVAGLVIVASAPGNDVRLSNLQGGVKWLTPFYGIYRGAGAIAVSGLVMYLLTANTLIAPLTQRLINAFYIKVNILSPKQRILLLVCIFGLFSAVFMPSYWAEGGSPAKRTQTILYILPLILWIPTMSIVMTFTGLKSIQTPWFNNHKNAGIVFSLVLFLAVAVTFNVKHIIADSLWSAKNYDKQLMERYKYIDNAKKSGIKNITVTNLTDLPKSMFFADILADPKHWRNNCYREYFELDSIKTAQ